MQNKINWISILQGWAMFLVVVGHVNLTGIFLDSQTPITSIIQKTIYSFHMPLFMFISGMLFWETRLKRDWNYKNILIDKAKRLLVPYFFFTVATFFIKLVASKFIYRPVDLNISYILRMFIIPDENPLGELWFVLVLYIIFAFYPITQIVKNEKQIISYIILVLSFLVSFFVPKTIRILAFSKVCYYYVFFLAGVLFMKANINEYLNNIYICILSIIIFSILTIFRNNTYIIIFAGIFMSCCLAVFFDRFLPNLFFTFRNYTFQIFLFGIFFQVGVRIIYQKLGMQSLYFPFYLIDMIAGLYIPVLISLIIKKIGNQYLKLICGLK